MVSRALELYFKRASLIGIPYPNDVILDASHVAVVQQFGAVAAPVLFEAPGEIDRTSEIVADPASRGAVGGGEVDEINGSHQDTAYSGFIHLQSTVSNIFVYVCTR